MEGIFLIFISFITILVCAMFVYIVGKLEKGFTIVIEEKSKEYEPVEDLFDKEGDVKDKETDKLSMDDVLRDINEFMTGVENDG